MPVGRLGRFFRKVWTAWRARLKLILRSISLLQRDRSSIFWGPCRMNGLVRRHSRHLTLTLRRTSAKTICPIVKFCRAFRNWSTTWTFLHGGGRKLHLQIWPLIGPARKISVNSTRWSAERPCPLHTASFSRKWTWLTVPTLKSWWREMPKGAFLRSQSPLTTSRRILIGKAKTRFSSLIWRLDMGFLISRISLIRN